MILYDKQIYNFQCVSCFLLEVIAELVADHFTLRKKIVLFDIFFLMLQCLKWPLVENCSHNTSTIPYCLRTCSENMSDNRGPSVDMLFRFWSIRCLTLLVVTSMLRWLCSDLISTCISSSSSHRPIDTQSKSSPIPLPLHKG